MDDSPLELSALELAGSLRSGAIGCEEATRFFLERIERLNPDLAAFVSVFDKSALKRARVLDSRRHRSGPKPVFWGVPTGIKDLDLVFSHRVRAGSRAFRYVVAPFDGESVRRIRRSGAVLLGKLATSELAIMPVTEPDIHPPTRNPFDRERSAGGSSGGSGAAVAGGLLPIAHAADGAGSIRIPSAFCHLFGMKPSRALLPNFYARSEPLGLSGTGSVAHTVKDTAAMLDVLAGRPFAGDDPSSLMKECDQEPGALRVRVWRQSEIVEPEPAVLAGVDRAAKALRDAGHSVEEGPPFRGSVEEFLPLMHRMVANVPVLWDGFFQPITRWMHREGRKVARDEARRIFDDLGRRVLEWFGDADLVLAPTVAMGAPRVGAFSGGDPEETFHRAAKLGAFTAPFNISGQPAASVPSGLTGAGLPMGVQVVGRADGDRTVLRVCRQLEQAMPWRGVRPEPVANVLCPPGEARR